MTNWSSNSGPFSRQNWGRSVDTKKATPIAEKWPEVLTFDKACEYIGMSDVQGRKLGFKQEWQEFGVAIHYPGETYPRYRKSKLDLWLDSVQEAQRGEAG